MGHTACDGDSLWLPWPGVWQLHSVAFRTLIRSAVNGWPCSGSDGIDRAAETRRQRQDGHDKQDGTPRTRNPCRTTPAIRYNAGGRPERSGQHPKTRSLAPTSTRLDSRYRPPCMLAGRAATRPWLHNRDGSSTWPSGLPSTPFASARRRADRTSIPRPAFHDTGVSRGHDALGRVDQGRGIPSYTRDPSESAGYQAHGRDTGSRVHRLTKSRKHG